MPISQPVKVGTITPTIFAQSNFSEGDNFWHGGDISWAAASATASQLLQKQGAAYLVEIWATRDDDAGNNAANLRVGLQALEPDSLLREIYESLFVLSVSIALTGGLKNVFSSSLETLLGGSVNSGLGAGLANKSSEYLANEIAARLNEAISNASTEAQQAALELVDDPLAFMQTYNGFNVNDTIITENLEDTGCCKRSIIAITGDDQQLGFQARGFGVVSGTVDITSSESAQNQIFAYLRHITGSKIERTFFRHMRITMLYPNEAG